MNNKEIWYLSDYDWLKGTLIKENKKTYTIEWTSCSNFYKPNEKIIQKFPKEKCAFSDELVCIIWERWKGKNGRGSHRVEKELYPHLRIPANQVSHQHISKTKNNGKATENVYGFINDNL